MTRVSLTVNGEAVTADVEPRMHLADFLRETQLLTGTHIGCEHGVCGACTVQIDGAPARSCITLAVTCEGAEVRTIEGFDEDPVMDALRGAFTKEHALQCGYCTPGMMIAARDIVTRLPEADADRVRSELEGNLCRCTGYVGIVRAVQSVLADPPLGAEAAETEEPAPEAEAAPAQSSSDMGLPAGAMRLSQSFSIARPRTEVWAIFRDIRAMANCMPGAELNGAPVDGHVRGRITAALGPIRGAFVGEADVTHDDAAFSGMVRGTGRDGATGSAAAGEVQFALHETGSDSTRVDIEVAYALSGALAQFGRSELAAGVAQALTDAFAANLEARLAGDETAAEPAKLDAGSLIGQVLRGWLAKLFGGGR